MDSTRHWNWWLILAGLTLSAAVASAVVSPSQRQRAAVTYEKAERMRATLEAKSEIKRPKQEYKKIIAAYYVVYHLNPAYSKAPAALTAIAELDREMGQKYSSDSYFLESIKSYRFLLEQYPHCRLSRGALFSVAEVYRDDLNDPVDARKTFQELITRYPRSEEAAEAKETIRQLDTRIAEESRSRYSPPPVERVSEEQPLLARQVTAVRHWVGPNYVRIVIEIDAEAKFDSVRLSNPDRIVVNLQNARLSSELVGKTFPVEDGFLRQIRVAQFSPEVARVVLDVEKIQSYALFCLPNPFRLVIDVQGGVPMQVAGTAKSVPPPNTAVRKPGKILSSASTSADSTSQIEAAAKASPTVPDPEPSTPSGYDEEPISVNTPPPSKHAKKPKDAAPTTATEVPPLSPPAVPMEPNSRTLTRALGLKIGRIVIDPGHGGHDTGTIGPTGLEEKDVVLDVGLKLRKLLELNTTCEVVMTRGDDTFIPLEERTAIANEKAADLFISIHANASHDESARGIETYYLNFTSSPEALAVAARENASSQEAVHQLQDLIKKIAMTEKIEESQDFARLVQREVYSRVTKVGGAQRDRGIKKAPFVVLIGANMPSILAEISFLTNPRDEQLLKRSEYREKIAYALYEGISGYLKNLGEVKTVQRVASGQTSTASQADF